MWELLNRKLERICTVHGEVMADPEDVKELVLGVASGADFERLMARAHLDRPARLEDWFETESATFGGESALRVAVSGVDGSTRRVTTLS